MHEETKKLVKETFKTKFHQESTVKDKQLDHLETPWFHSQFILSRSKPSSPVCFLPGDRLVPTLCSRHDQTAVKCVIIPPLAPNREEKQVTLRCRSW